MRPGVVTSTTKIKKIKPKERATVGTFEVSVLKEAMNAKTANIEALQDKIAAYDKEMMQQNILLLEARQDNISLKKRSIEIETKVKKEK